MKEKRVEGAERAAPTTDRKAVPQDSRPPEQTESTTRHVFLVIEGVYRCSRCGADMNDRTLNEECPAGGP